MESQYDSGTGVEGSVISFIEKTWFLWWIFAALVILRWFQLFSSTPKIVREASASDAEQVAKTAVGPVGSGSVNDHPYAV
jgi:hypothetical protein